MATKSKSDSIQVNPVIGAVGGAFLGSFFGPSGTVIGAVLGAGIGFSQTLDFKSPKKHGRA